MPITIQPLTVTGSQKMIRDADVDATAENNVNDGPATIYGLDIDNAANAAVTYVKFYNNAAPTVGTTDPDMIIRMPASVRRTFFFVGGLAFATALSYAAVTAAGTAGTTSPTSDVIMTIVVA